MPKRSSKKVVRSSGVVVVQTQQRKPRRAKARRNSKRAPSSSLAKSGQHYFAALTRPFSESAVGAVIPDGHRRLSVPQRFNGTVTCLSNASGVIKLLLTPHPSYVIVDNVGTGNITGLATYAANANLYKFADIGTMSSAMNMFRIVSAGFKIRNIIAPLNTTGAITVAPTPLCRQFPGKQIADAKGFTVGGVIDGVTDLFGGGQTSIGGWVLGLPGARRSTLQELMSDELHMVSRPYGPNAMQWKNCDISPFWGSTAAYTASSELDLDISTTPWTTYNANSSFQSVQDLEGFILYADGLPASINCLEIDFVIHIETVPAPTSGFFASSAFADTGGPFDAAQAQSLASQSPAVSFWSEFLDDIKAGARLAAGSAMRSTARALGEMFDPRFLRLGNYT